MLNRTATDLFMAAIDFMCCGITVWHQSLKSRGYVKEQYAWRHYYWYLTNEGIQFLRDELHLPPEIVPATLKRQTRTETARPSRAKGLHYVIMVRVQIFNSF